jgi:hypothetical protein
MNTSAKSPIAQTIDRTSEEFLDLHKTFPVFMLTLTKHCCKCKETRPLERFSPDRKGRYGMGSTCKDCANAEQKRRWATLHPKASPPSDGYKKCPKCDTEKLLELFSNNKTSKDGKCAICKACVKQYQTENKETMKAKNKVWRKENKEKVAKQAAKWRKANPERVAKQQRDYARERKKIDPAFKLRCQLRSRIFKVIKRGQKSGSAIKDLGCSVDELKIWIESKFQPGMTWGNWGQSGWHIDHITSLANFDLTNRGQFLTACHYTNLQPLWWYDNLEKRKTDIY